MLCPRCTCICWI